MCVLCVGVFVTVKRARKVESVMMVMMMMIMINLSHKADLAVL